MDRINIKSKCDFMKFKNNRLNYKCKEYGKRCSKSINGLIKKLLSVYQFCDGNPSKSVLLSRKSVYPYQYMNSWEKFDELSLPSKNAFDSKLNLEEVSDKDYNYAQKVGYVFEIKHLGDYHDLYVKTNTLLLADVLRNLGTNILKYMNLILLISYLRLEYHGKRSLKKTNVNLEFLTDIDMFLMIGAGIRGVMCQAVLKYVKANNKYMKNYDKSIESS